MSHERERERERERKLKIVAIFIQYINKYNIVNYYYS